MDFIEPCFGIGHNLSLIICQMTSEDIKHQLIIILVRIHVLKPSRKPFAVIVLVPSIKLAKSADEQNCAVIYRLHSVNVLYKRKYFS